MKCNAANTVFNGNFGPEAIRVWLPALPREDPVYKCPMSQLTMVTVNQRLWLPSLPREDPVYKCPMSQLTLVTVNQRTTQERLDIVQCYKMRGRKICWSFFSV